MKPKLLILFQVCFVLIQEGKTSTNYPVNFTDKISYTGRLERHAGCVVNENECDNLCFHHQRFKSFFYHNDFGICQLHFNTFTPTSDQLVESPGWKYHGAAAAVTDCQDIMEMGNTESGKYQITTLNGMTRDVYCYFQTNVPDTVASGSYAWNGASTYCHLEEALFAEAIAEVDNAFREVFQRRYDGSVDFYRTWNEYANGFGSVMGEYWLGNEILNELTSQRSYALSVWLVKAYNVTRYANYSTFKLSSNDTGYTLTVGGYTGDAGDSLTYHNGKRFYTKDIPDSYGCFKTYLGAWWYNTCFYSMLNGVYGTQRGIIWSGFYYAPLTSSWMMIRRLL